MRSGFSASDFAALSLLAFVMGVGDEARAQGRVCPDPARPRGESGPHELSFRIGGRYNFDRSEDRSAPFYAVILRSAELCRVPEEERLNAQALFPRHKVFVRRYFCQDFGDNVTYTNVDRKKGFVAVYAGETEAAARKFLGRVRATGQFPDANLRRMQVVLVYQLE